MINVIIIGLAIIFLFGCDKGVPPEKESAKAENRIPEEIKYDTEANSIVQSVVVPGGATSQLFFNEMLEGGDPAQFEERFLKNIVGTYEELNVPEFIDASKELTNYRNVLARKLDLQSWLLASLIEKAITGSVLRKLQDDQLSPAEAYEIVKGFQVRMYSVDRIGQVVDGSQVIVLSPGFTSTEQEILKEKFGLDHPSLASEGYRYRALFEHIATTSNESGSLEPARLKTLSSLFQLFGTYKESLMVSIYTKYLSEGGESLSKDSGEINSSAIEDALKSQYLPEFHTMGSARIRLHELRSLLKDYE